MGEKVCIVGLGYVGLPLAVAFAKEGLAVTGFDVNEKRISELRSGRDATNEVESRDLGATASSIEYTTDQAKIREADFVIICVPTPVTKSKEPDMRYVQSAAEVVGKNLKRGAIIVLESTVYPGATEEIVVPIVEKTSGYKLMSDFKIGFSPERINPGDREHTIDRVIKVVSGIDQESLEKIAALYSKVCKAGVFKAKNIKTAEAAKVIENVQRDLNIALMNELSLIFDKMGIDTRDVLAAASTKWNFVKYAPGLVGGHCIPEDPYYLVCKALELGHHPQIILAGRGINEGMPHYVANMMVKLLNKAGKPIQKSRVLLMGLTYKENVNDTRTSPAFKIIDDLRELGVEVHGYDPLLEPANLEKQFGIPAMRDFDARNFDGIIVMSPHKVFSAVHLDQIRKQMNGSPVIIDIKGFYSKEEAEELGFVYKRL